MIRDRGRMKWTSMMLPEHVKLLRDWSKEDSFEKEKEIDEQQLEDLNIVAAEAMEYGKCVTITHYTNKRYELLVGTLHSWDAYSETFQVIDRFEAKHEVALKRIIDLRLSD
ncbi:YolD-like family protein [Bacillus sp. 2205SS5-2]|uniref:YolD-like family protein n=1 Tax=Bacillus sp. 2205SS5-2 TaxID=3109031 RepID=UPI0030078D7F